LSDEKPVLGNEKADRDVDFKSVNVTEQAPDRRRLFRRLVALAGLGITGALLSQDKTGILPAVQATTYVTVDNAVTGAATTTLDSTTNGTAFSVEATNSTTDTETTAIAGTADATSGIGVYGSGNLNGVRGFSENSIGMYGVSAGTSGAGVYGFALAPPPPPPRPGPGLAY
jgi:hypothetical protein